MSPPSEMVIMDLAPRRAMSDAEARDKLLDALELVLCKHGRSATFAALMLDVLKLMESGGDDLPPMLLVANPSAKYATECREQGKPCPPSARVEGAVVSGDLAELWERRVRRLLKPCEPLSGCNRRVAEATWHSHHTSAAGRKSGYWSLLLECGHVVKKRVRSDRRPSHVPRYTACCLCARRENEP